MIGHRNFSAAYQSNFYRDQYRKLLIALVASIVIMLGLILAIIYVVLNQPKPEYYASTLNGQVIRMIPK